MRFDPAALSLYGYVVERVPRTNARSVSEGDSSVQQGSPSHTHAARAPQVESWALSLGTMLGQLQDGVYVFDAYQVRPVNRAALTLLGYDGDAEFQQDPASLLRELDVRDSGSRRPVSVQALALPAHARVRELIIRHRKTGEDRFVRCALSPILAAGTAVGAVAVIGDVTERVSSEAAAKKRAEFEQQLIGIVSHDLRNPLQVIRFAAALGLKAAAHDARQTRQFERIMSSSARAIRMIDDLLDFTPTLKMRLPL